jgi:hypothetical protein
MDTTMIRCVIATLNDIEVKGRDNLDKLLGSIMALEGVAKMMEQPTPEEPKEEAHG